MSVIFFVTASILMNMLAQNLIDREIRTYTFGAFMNGGEVYAFTQNMNWIHKIYPCMGLYDCSEHICEMAQLPNVTYAGFRPSISSDSCSITPNVSDIIPRDKEVYDSIMTTFKAINILDIIYMILHTGLFIILADHMQEYALFTKIIRGITMGYVLITAIIFIVTLTESQTLVSGIATIYSSVFLSQLFLTLINILIVLVCVNVFYFVGLDIYFLVNFMYNSSPPPQQFQYSEI